MLSVTYFYREPRKTGVSIEGIFKLVSSCLEDKVAVRDHFCDGQLSRIQNTRLAGKYTSDINHITGDVNFLAMGLRKGKIILTIHDFGFYENPIHNKLKKFFYHTFWFHFPLKSVDIVTVVSGFTKEKLIRYFNFPENRIRVIPDPVKPIFQFVAKPAFTSKPVVLMLGTGKHKNLDGLIEAAKGTDFHLDIVGWPAPDEIERLKVYNIDYTVYNGLSDQEVYERYIACDVLFIASHYEGFGMPIIEAQAVGRPVVTSNIGAMKEVGEGSALLVDPKSAEQIREAIRSLAQPELHEKMVALGTRNAAKYNYKTIANQYLDVYRELHNN